jgi:hypothetical protein
VVVVVAVAGVAVVVAVAGVVDALGAAGVVDVLGAAGVVDVLGAAGLEVVLVAGVALGDVLVVAGVLPRGDFFAAGVALVAGCSAEVFVSGAAAGVDFRVGGAFFSVCVAAGDLAVAGSFTAGA